MQSIKVHIRLKLIEQNKRASPVKVLQNDIENEL
jgi:hypothetical protein